MGTQHIFHNLTIKFPKPHLEKGNSGSQLEGLQISEKEIESLPLFKSKLERKLLLLAMKLNTYINDKAILVFCESFLFSKTNINLIIYNQKKYLCNVFIIFVKYL